MSFTPLNLFLVATEGFIALVVQKGGDPGGSAFAAHPVGRWRSPGGKPCLNFAQLRSEVWGIACVIIPLPRSSLTNSSKTNENFPSCPRMNKRLRKSKVHSVEGDGLILKKPPLTVNPSNDSEPSGGLSQSPGGIHLGRRPPRRPPAGPPARNKLAQKGESNYPR